MCVDLAVKLQLGEELEGWKPKRSLGLRDSAAKSREVQKQAKKTALSVATNYTACGCIPEGFFSSLPLCWLFSQGPV